MVNQGEGDTTLRDPGIYFRFRPQSLRQESARSGRLIPAVFLDRDGVIVEEVNYLHRLEDLRLLPGALETIQDLNDRGWMVVVVTNQAGIGRGYYGWPEFEVVQTSIETSLENLGGWFDAVCACGYHEDGIGILRQGEHPFRKPNIGMLAAAAERLGIELSASWLIGDSRTDIEAAMNAHLRGAIQVRSGHGSRDRGYVRSLAVPSHFQLLFAEDLTEAGQMVALRTLAERNSL